jgi:RNA:NAD 2'-phosphotransferase (TPT1/KptA family)
MLGVLIRRTSRVIGTASRNFAQRAIMNEHPKQTKQRDRKSHQQSSAKLKGSPRDDPKTRLSKTLSYVLRHGAEKEGISIRPDGFVLVNDLVG